MKLIMENWRRFTEDEERRQALAKGLKDLGREEENFEDMDNRAGILRQLEQGRDLKKVFHQHADRQFLDSLVTIHWTHTEQKLIELLGGKVGSRDELSAAAYLPEHGGQIGQGAGAIGEFGLLIKGHITLLANEMDQLYTGRGEDAKRANPERAKMSGANKGVKQIYEPDAYEKFKILVLDKDDWKPRTKRSGVYNEALVDNWNPMAVIVPSDPGGNRIPGFEELIKKAGLDIPVMSSEEFGGKP